MNRYCKSCLTETHADSAVRCVVCGGELALDRRIFEPDLPAMGTTPADDWVAVYQPRDAAEAERVQELLEAGGVPAMILPGSAGWARELPAGEPSAVVHVAVPTGQASAARDALGARPATSAKMRPVARDRTWLIDVQVCPSILAADFGAFRSQVSDLLDAGARTFHVDVMDGRFVPVITFGPAVVAALADTVHERGGALAVHLMVEQPERFVSEFARAGADAFTIHVEATPHVHYALQTIREAGMAAGVTLNPGTPVAALEEAAASADNLLCMSVNPGWGGQRFIPASLRRLTALRAACPEGAGVEIDGGVGPDTIVDCYAAGANRLTAGSAIYAAKDPGAAYQSLVERVRASAPPPWA